MLSDAAKELKLGQFLKKSNFFKTKGVSITSLLMVLVSLVFYSKNLFQYLHSKYGENAACKNTYYRLLTNPSYNWPKLLLTFAINVISFFIPLTAPSRAKVLILDDTPIVKNRSKRMELLSRAHNHVNNTFYKGFTCLTLGWSDGYSFVPLSFNLLSSANEKNRINPCSESIDKRSNGYKIRILSQMHKPDAAYLMIKNALNKGCLADYVLMDSWFTSEPLISKLVEEGLDVIGMLKSCNNQYWYKGKLLKLKQLWQFVSHKKSCSDIYGSLLVHTSKNKIPLKIVFVKNCANPSEFLCIASTKITLNSKEIIRLYGRRWQIETFFKNAKSLLRFGHDCESTNYGALVASSTIVFIRYILLEFLRRKENDTKTLGSLFAYVCDDLPDIPYAEAIKYIGAIFNRIVQYIKGKTKKLQEFMSDVVCQVNNWFLSLPSYIKVLLPNFSWES